ncbi:MAG: bis(5'-nucleosyl)-tetraphosphatase (symmetrical) YqeK [Lachnospiraceae bacterium]|nr:bis(5'-nucleosyl)-tetraphosphatase (symmetrical) YqeK [Lachnospiraceae bacterium]
MKKKLKKKRYIHSVGVMYTAMNLAMRYDYDIEKAGIAGILHDCAKEYDDDEMIKLCEKNKIEITETERKAPYLLHAKLGAYMAKHEYGIDDEEILSAITWHTTGKPEMTLLDKIIFVADYIEPSRKKTDYIDSIRKYAFTDLDKAVYTELYGTLKYVQEKDAIVDENSVLAYEYYEKMMVMD